MKKSKLIAEKETLLRGWKLSFTLNPFGTVKGWSNILHGTIGKDHGRNGDRTPGIWFRSQTTKLYICSSVNGDNNYCYNSAPIPLHENTSIQIQQVQLESNHQYHYQIFINKKRMLNTLNKVPMAFKNVKYYASDPWYNPAHATISNFNLTMMKYNGKIFKV